jgi:hypothetical protein
MQRYHLYFDQGGMLGKPKCCIRTTEQENTSDNDNNIYNWYYCTSDKLSTIYNILNNFTRAHNTNIVFHADSEFKETNY